MEHFSDRIKKGLLKFFMLDIPKFTKVVIEKKVFEDICNFAKELHPKEFVAVLEGKVIKKELVISKIYYQPFGSSERSAFFSSFLPNSVNGIGTVHSHPSSNTNPSRADLEFFNKKGVVHFIIGYPYTEDSVAAYDFNGERIGFEIR